MENERLETAENKIINIDVNDVHLYLLWLDNQQKDYLNGQFLYDVKGCYKRLKLSEMFDYWLEHVYSH